MVLIPEINNMDYEHGHSCVCYSRITFNVVVLQINNYYCIIFVSVKDIIRKYTLNMIELLLKLYILVYYAVHPNNLSNMPSIPYYSSISLCITCRIQQLYSADINISMNNNNYYKVFFSHIYKDVYYNIKNKTYINILKNVYYDSKYIEYLYMYTSSRYILVITLFYYKVECLISSACINMHIIYTTFVYFDNLVHVHLKCIHRLLNGLNIPLTPFIRSPSQCKITNIYKYYIYLTHTIIEINY